MQRSTPPFRADVVGSLLRPEKLKTAREQLLGEQSAGENLGPHSNAALRAVEDECVLEAIAMQQRVGLKVATDGEARRRSWWLELIMSWQGFAANRQGASEFAWRNTQGVQQLSSRLWINGPIRWQAGAVARAFEFLHANTKATAKVTIPSPMVVYMLANGDPGIREGHYKDVDQFWADLVQAYRQEIAALTKAGATYIQLDDTAIAFLCDPIHRATVRGWGMDPDQLLVHFAERTNEVLAGLPAGVTVTLHQCRGNREGQWVADGGYDPVADILFNRIDVHGYFLEYDTPRAGSFTPLRLLPKGKIAVLGLVSSKAPKLETADELKRRIDEAAKLTPLDQLALSTQCGFASSIKGNPLTASEQEAKLARIVEVADAVWR